MPFRRISLTLVLFLATSLFLPSITFAQNASAAGDWSALKTIDSGSKLSVKLKGGKSIEGKLTDVTDSALVLSVSNKPVELRREDIFSIYQFKKKSATKATLIGMGAGAGLGLGIGLAGSGGNNSLNKIDHAVTAGLTVVGAGAGALTGYLIGRGGTKRVLVYQAP